MPVTDPYAGTPEEFTEPMWKEFVASNRPSGENIFNKRSGEAALVGFVPAASLKAAMRFMLGYEQVTNTSPFLLKRKNPIRHPYYEQLWCNGVAEVEFKPDATSREAIKKMSNAVRTFTPAALQYRTGYKYAKLVVRFGPTEVKYREDVDPDYTSLSDDRLEFRRNVVVDMEPRVETFETKQKWKFAQGEGIPVDVPFYSNPKGSDVVAERAQVLVKPDVVIRWQNVPEAWIMESNTHKPYCILFCLGTVNHGDFLGFEAGTLLFVGAKMTRYPWTLKPRPGLPGSGLESEFLYDVELQMSYFDPPKGFTGSPPALITTFKGHNNAPYRGLQDTEDIAVEDMQSRLWFHMTHNGATDGKTLYDYTDFTIIFDCPQNY